MITITIPVETVEAYMKRKIRKVYYAPYVHMSYGDKTLREICEYWFGANISPGDIFVCTNKSKTARKILMRGDHEWCILHTKADKPGVEYVEPIVKGSIVKAQKKELPTDWR